MASGVLTLCAVLAVLAARSAALRTHPGQRQVIDGGLHLLTSVDPGCHVQRQTLDNGQRTSTTIQDFDSRMVLYKYSESDGTCYVRFMTEQEWAGRCQNTVIPLENAAIFQHNVTMRVVGDLDVAMLPRAITRGATCTRALLVEPDSAQPPSEIPSGGPMRKRRGAVAEPEEPCYVLVGFLCVDNGDGTCTLYAVIYEVPCL